MDKQTRDLPKNLNIFRQEALNYRASEHRSAGKLVRISTVGDKRLGLLLCVVILALLAMIIFLSKIW